MRRAAFTVMLALLVAHGARAADTPAPTTTFQDCADCPAMVVIPAGHFVMGTTAAEANREGAADLAKRTGMDPDKIRGWSQPQHEVTIAKPFALGKYPVTVAQYAQFVKETHYPDPDSCVLISDKNALISTKGINWHNPGFPQTPDDPVVCVGWQDSIAYLAWLTDKTGLPYRMPSEAEWEYAARAGTNTSRPWGDDPNAQCAYANGADLDTVTKVRNPRPAQCHDGYVYTAPVNALKPNAFGLYSMIGNTWEWNADCWNENYEGAPTDGSAWLTGDCTLHTERGGPWNLDPSVLRAGNRARNTMTIRHAVNGLRVARDL